LPSCLIFENLNQHSVGAFEHDIFKVPEIPDGRSELEALRLHKRDQCGNIIRVDCEVMHGVSPEIPGRLVIKIDMAGSYADQYIPHTGKNSSKTTPAPNISV
jgi:hypothetical protein